MDFTGRPMKQFLFVSPKGVAKETSLRNWVAEALEFVKTLPPRKRIGNSLRRSGLEFLDHPLSVVVDGVCAVLMQDVVRGFFVDQI